MFDPKIKYIIENKLYTLVDSDDTDVFNKCFENWQNPIYLYDFFKKHEKDLSFYRMSVKQAAANVIHESFNFYNRILDTIESEEIDESLDQNIFQPLHDRDDFDLPLIQTKSYGNKMALSFIRLYAIRLSDGCYIIVGGLIKTKKKLQEMEEGKEILKKLKQLEKHLRDNGFEDAFDIRVLIC